MFAPRWLFLLPIPLLMIASAIRRCPWHWAIQAITALVVAGPLMGFSIPFSRFLGSYDGGERLRIATFNLSAHPLRLQRLHQWIEEQKLDVVCFQEVHGRDDVRVHDFEAEGFRVSKRGTIISRLPITAEYPDYPENYDTEERYSSSVDRLRVRLSDGSEVTIASIHLPTLRPGFERFLKRFTDVEGLSLHVAWWGREMSRVLTAMGEVSDVPLVVAGDFNMPGDDSTMAALRTNFRFAFDEAGWGYGYTRPASLPWVRIDHILLSQEWSALRCWVGPDFGSDHLPLVAEMTLPLPARPTPSVKKPEAAAVPTKDPASAPD